MALPPIILGADLDELIALCERNGIPTEGSDAQAMQLALSAKTKRQCLGYHGPMSVTSRGYQRSKGFS
jgi:hypothetical protein